MWPRYAALNANKEGPVVMVVHVSFELREISSSILKPVYQECKMVASTFDWSTLPDEKLKLLNSHPELFTIFLLGT